MVTIVGVPLDENSSYLRGAAEGPDAIRQALHSGAMNWCTEDGFDLAASSDWQDAGNLTLPSGAAAFDEIEHGIHAHLENGGRVLVLGGDHAITFPVIKAFAHIYPNLTILDFDAHPDTYDEYEGNRRSHACPFARIMEAGLAKRLVQVGIRTMTPHQDDQAHRFGIETIPMREWCLAALPQLSGPLYLSLDLDVLDPAFAPGVAHHEPGGLATRDLLAVVQGLTAPLVGADIVELNPGRDSTGITTSLAAKLAKEVLRKLILSGA
ncbi:MAG: agmatinase [Anaerolineales bacterium]|nr:agmatinase [Anaerolineales bacterium]